MVGLDATHKCESWRGGLGSEPTIEMYIGHMILICREIARTLRPDGTFWLNIADSYNGSGGLGTTPGISNRGGEMAHYPGRSFPGLQEGDMIFIPQRLALALQADGWIVRRDVIWAKNAMPEPRKGWRWQKPPCSCVTEQREAHIAKQIEEQGTDRSRISDMAGTKFKPDPNCPNCHGTGRLVDNPDVFIPESWRHTASHEYVFQLVKAMHYFSDHTRVATETGSNPRDVLHPSRTNYSGKHFAVFPAELIAPMIQASVPKHTCGLCQKPWAPELDGKSVTGYRPTCDCAFAADEDAGPGWVFDPFMGSGTTGLAAKEFGVSFIGIDISFEYLDEQAKVRTGLGNPSKQLDGLPLFKEIGNA